MIVDVKSVISTEVEKSLLYRKGSLARQNTSRWQIILSFRPNYNEWRNLFLSLNGLLDFTRNDSRYCFNPLLASESLPPYRGTMIDLGI